MSKQYVLCCSAIQPTANCLRKYYLLFHLYSHRARICEIIIWFVVFFTNVIIWTLTDGLTSNNLNRRLVREKKYNVWQNTICSTLSLVSGSSPRDQWQNFYVTAASKPKEKIISCAFCQFNCHGYFFSYLRAAMHLHNLNIFVSLFSRVNNLP